MKLLVAICFLLIAFVTTIIVGVTSTRLNFESDIIASSSDCSASDKDLVEQQAIICASINGASINGDACCANVPKPAPSVTVHQDWSKQGVYVTDLLTALGTPSRRPCLNTTTARSVVHWLTGNFSNINKTCSLFYTWDKFQFQYYDMPRKPGNRIESSWTLGNKGWSFTQLAHNWHPEAIKRNLEPFGLSLGDFATQYQASLAPSFQLCNKVIANCFVNKSYDPKRNGTCKIQVDEFKLGFEFENIRCWKNLKFPFYA